MNAPVIQDASRRRALGAAAALGNQQFWAAGNASKIKQQDINYYAGLYAKGSLY